MKKSIHLLVFACLLSGSLPAQNSDAPQEKEKADEYTKFRVGGYGEILFQHMNYGPWRYAGDGSGSGHDKRSQFSVPRFVIAINYKFGHGWELGSEIEFEYGGTGAAIEHEYTESGEYETEIEKGGEVALEQFHLTKRFSRAFAIRAGHMIVPVGLTNAHHEPINFFGASRPEGEMTLIPCTWHETGVAVLGAAGDFNYQAMVVTGLDPNGFDTQNWIRNGRQARFEIATMTNPAYVARVDYSGLKHTRLGVAGYYSPRTTSNASNPGVFTKYDIKGSVALVSADGQYKSRDLIVRANVLYGRIGESAEISAQNARIPKATGFKRTPVAQNALTYFAEAGYNIGRFFDYKASVFPFIRYEYLNSMQGIADGHGLVKDPRNDLKIVSAGVNYYALPNLVVKADYAHRRVASGTCNSESTFSLGLAYIGWFFSK